MRPLAKQPTLLVVVMHRSAGSDESYCSPLRVPRQCLCPSQSYCRCRTRSNDGKLNHMTPCFNDWKRFCFVLREIASGENGRPLPGFEAQMRAQGVLVECGYTWPGRAEVHKPIVGHAAAPGDHNAKAPVEPQLASAGAKLKSAGEVQSRSGPRRSDPPPSAHCCERRPRASSLAPTYRAL
jgi:hypothetical protein